MMLSIKAKKEILSLLVTTHTQTKASIKYDIKQLESRLQQCLPYHPESHALKDALLFSQLLSHYYHHYYRLIASKNVSSIGEASITHLDWNECYQRINRLKSQYYAYESTQEEIDYVRTLYAAYRQLSLLLKLSSSFQNTKNSIEPSHEIKHELDYMHDQVLSQRDNATLEKLFQLLNEIN